MYKQFISWSVLECSYAYIRAFTQALAVVLAVTVVSEDGSSEQE